MATEVQGASRICFKGRGHRKWLSGTRRPEIIESPLETLNFGLPRQPKPAGDHLVFHVRLCCSRKQKPCVTKFATFCVLKLEYWCILGNDGCRRQAVKCMNVPHTFTSDLIYGCSVWLWQWLFRLTVMKQKLLSAQRFHISGHKNLL